MVLRTRPSSGLVSFQMDWETSVSAHHGTHCSPTLSLTVASPIAGHLSDIVVRRWREKRKGVWFPEDRLRATWIGGLFMVPLSVGASGLITTYVGGPIGLSLNLLCLFVNGMGASPFSYVFPLRDIIIYWILQVDFVLSPIASYNVDIMHSRSAEATAASASVP